MCKVNAAIATQILIDSYGCDRVINAGTAGGIGEGVEVFDTIVATEVAYHDMASDILTDFHPWLPSVYFASDENLLSLARKVSAEFQSNGKIRFGRMVTGEQFVEGRERERIQTAYMPLSVDMESAAVAHVCYVNRVPFLSVRTITDTLEHDGCERFEQNCKKASQLSADFVRAMLKAL